MGLEYLNQNASMEAEVENTATVANAMAIASGAISDLIGVDLGRSKEVDFEEFIAVCIGEEVNKAISINDTGENKNAY